MRLGFISDLHLSADTPATTAALLAFLAGEARQLAGLYILGDFFDYWVGDDQLTDPLARQVATALHELSDQGVPVALLHGNRDFLLGHDFARAAGLTLLPDPHVLEWQGQRIVLSHGDALCTDDLAYQQVRHQLRDPAWQQAFLVRPLAERHVIARQLRARSQESQHQDDYIPTDINPEALHQLVRDHGYPAWLIHGHTHRPAIHTHQIDGHTLTRVVLADWHDTAQVFFL